MKRVKKAKPKPTAKPKTTAKRSASRDLATALRDDPDDTELALVYADALARKGDPRGDLIVMQHRAETAKGDTLAKIQAGIAAHLREHADALLGPLDDGDIALTWRRGFVHRLEMKAIDATTMHHTLAHPSVQHVAEVVFDHVTAAEAISLVELPLIDQLARLEILLDDWLEMAKVVDALAKRKRPKLTTFVLGSTMLEEREKQGALFMAWDNNPLVDIESILKLADATPKLTDLELRGEYLFGGLEHPNLRRLTIFGDAINGLPWTYLDGDVSLPRLERLEMTLLMDEYRYPPAFPLTLDKEQTPKLRELLIHNPSHHYNDGTEGTLLGFLRDSAILPQLRALTIADVRQDEDLDARAFRHLDQFHVDALVSDDEAEEDLDDFKARFRRAFPKATFGDVQ